MTLRDLVFSDLFVAESAANSWFKLTSDALNVSLLPEDYHDDLLALRHYLDTSPKKHLSGYAINWPVDSGERIRIERFVTLGGIIYVARRYFLAPEKLTDLGFPAMLAKQLLAPDLTEGLIVFLGKPGSGKTTAAIALIIERLVEYGGVCWTIENPIEIDWQGPHGKGWCYQTQVDSDHDISTALQHLVRGTPNIIMIGELRSPEAVRAAIEAGTSGNLIVATCHSPDLLTGLARLARLAGDDNNANASLSDALAVAIHLTLYNKDSGSLLKQVKTKFLDDKTMAGTGTPPRVLTVEPLWLSGLAGVSTGIKKMVNDGEFHRLVSEVERQGRLFLMKKIT